MTSRPSKRETVAVVDDDPIILELLRERLERAGYTVLTHEGAFGTSEFISRTRPDFLLLDVMMPGLSGDRLAALLKRQVLTARVAVIFHSSKNEHDLAELVDRTGAVGSIEKTGSDTRFLSEFERLASRVRNA